MVERFLRAATLAAFFIPAVAFAQAPTIKPSTELDLAEQQLLQIHKVYDEMERGRVLDMQTANTAIQKWMDYYKSCKPADKWLCDE